MWVFLLVIAVLFVLGPLFLLLRTARKPKLPKGFIARPYADDPDDD